MSPEPQPQRDLLLTAGKVMSRLLQIIIGIAAAIVAIILPVILFNTDQVAERLVEAGSEASLPMMLAAIVAVLLLILIVAALSFHFFRLLSQIIDTVSDGEPFTADNSERLNRMGWIALIFQIASIPIGALAAYIAMNIPSDDFSADFEFSLTGILFAIVLFILARIFRQGAAMRDDLEGTV